MVYKFELEEFGAWEGKAEKYFLELLNGEATLEETIRDLASFRNSEHYTGTQEKFKITLPPEK